MNIPFAVAGANGRVAFVVHTFVGGRYAVVPLIDDERVPAATRGLNYLCWHAATAALFIMAATAFGSAFGPVSHDAVWAMGLIAAAISGISVIAARRVGISPWRFPSTYLLGAMALSIATDLL